MVKQIIKIISGIIILMLISCIEDIYYCTLIDWDINFTNHSSYDITVSVHSTNDIGWGNRLDSLDLKPVTVPANSTTVLRIEYVKYDEDDVPAVSDEFQNRYEILMKNDILDSLIYEIDLFPFPKWQNYVLCDEYIVSGSSMYSGEYECYASFTDSITYLSSDSVLSTAEYFKEKN